MRILTSPKRSAAGLSLMETMVASVIGSMLIAVILSLSSYTAKSFAAISNYVMLDRASRKTLDRLTMMIRESDGVTSFTNNVVQLSYHGAPLLYFYNRDQKTLVERLNNTNNTLLTGCDSFTFGIYQRNTVGGSYDQYPAALDQSEAKIIQVSWVCSKKLLGTLINTESIQSAKIVIRK